jgi:hypothetical protein
MGGGTARPDAINALAASAAAAVGGDTLVVTAEARALAAARRCANEDFSVDLLCASGLVAGVAGLAERFSTAGERLLPVSVAGERGEEDEEDASDAGDEEGTVAAEEDEGDADAVAVDLLSLSSCAALIESSLAAAPALIGSVMTSFSWFFLPLMPSLPLMLLSVGFDVPLVLNLFALTLLWACGTGLTVGGAPGSCSP